MNHKENFFQSPEKEIFSEVLPLSWYFCSWSSDGRQIQKDSVIWQNGIQQMNIPVHIRWVGQTTRGAPTDLWLEEDDSGIALGQMIKKLQWVLLAKVSICWSVHLLITLSIGPKVTSRLFSLLIIPRVGSNITAPEELVHHRPYPHICDDKP